ncbi:MAG TPA: hypothetical protein ENG74_03295, partial [Thermoplasmatales archaeon]|nr:hypothetical protein [Thermoplasmatales archaeon]
QDIYYRDSEVLLISFHQDGRTLYPGTGAIHEIGEDDGKGFTVNLPFVPGSGNESYMYAFDKIVPPLIEQFSPELIIYQSGVDTHHSDPLANILLTYPTYSYLAKRIKRLSETTCNKLLILFGGGYNSRASVYSYYNVICGLLDKRDIIIEPDIKDRKIDITKERVEVLRELLVRYWDV